MTKLFFTVGTTASLFSFSRRKKGLEMKALEELSRGRKGELSFTSKSHPFYTGKRNYKIKTGRVEKFRSRFLFKIENLKKNK